MPQSLYLGHEHIARVGLTSISNQQPILRTCDILSVYYAPSIPPLYKMATPRLPFLYPNFFRSIKSCEPTTWRSIRTPPTQKQGRKARLHTSQRRAQDTQHLRYGPAVGESRLPPPTKPAESLYSVNSSEPKEEAAKADARQKEAEKDESPPQQTDSKGDVEVAESGKEDTPLGREETKAGLTEEDKAAKPEPKRALDMVLQIPSPSEIKGKADRHPHLEASPYEHHFDTYSLVQDLIKHGYTEDQAVTLMKSIRLMLAINLDIAKEGLVSKSDTENETYLFRAACSELRTTLQTSRQTEVQRQRTQRAHLSHEADILSQKMTQDLLTLKEDMKAMFHNRKMAVQDDKRNLDGKIQELNYKITVSLNSDAKSEVEGLRWILTRRAAMAIGCAAGITPLFHSHLIATLTEVQSWCSSA